MHCSCFIQKFKSALCIRSMLFDKCLKEYFQFPYFQLLLKKLKKRLTTMHAFKLSRICLFAGMLYQTHATNARPSREGIIPGIDEMPKSQIEKRKRNMESTSRVSRREKRNVDICFLVREENENFCKKMEKF